MRALLLSILCAASVAAVTPDRTAAPEPTSGCTFAISPPISAAVVAGDNDAARRASVMAQPDSPLRILGVDLSGLVLNAGYESFTRHGRHVMDVQNVSDEVISEARVMVKVGFSSGSGVGSGTKLRRSLKPGERARIEWSAGTGRGTDNTDREAFVVALVEEVQTADCTYRPSQAWRNPPPRS